ncbi:hypothetical protein ACLOJK_012335 [Asimina triloba]
MPSAPKQPPSPVRFPHSRTPVASSLPQPSFLLRRHLASDGTLFFSSVSSSRSVKLSHNHPPFSLLSRLPPLATSPHGQRAPASFRFPLWRHLRTASAPLPRSASRSGDGSSRRVRASASLRFPLR